MSLVPCPYCRHLVSDKARVCPTCGGDLTQQNQVSEPSVVPPADPQPPRKRRRWVFWTMALLIVVLVAGVYLLMPQLRVEESVPETRDTVSQEMRQQTDSLHI